MRLDEKEARPYWDNPSSKGHLQRMNSYRIPFADLLNIVEIIKNAISK